MSMLRETTVDCGGCGASQTFVIWDSLNVTLDREQKDALLNGDLTRFTCKKCGWTGDVAYSLLYHDMEKSFMLWFVPGEGEPDTAKLPFGNLMGNYRFRLVRIKNQLIEKIFIFEAGFDDRVIEFYKLGLLANSVETGHAIVGELLFGKTCLDEQGSKAVRFEHLLQSGTEGLVVPESSLNETRDALANILPSAISENGKWLTVDQEYAQALLRNMQP